MQDRNSSKHLVVWCKEGTRKRLQTIDPKTPKRFNLVWLCNADVSWENTREVLRRGQLKWRLKIVSGWNEDVIASLHWIYVKACSFFKLQLVYFLRKMIKITWFILFKAHVRRWRIISSLQQTTAECQYTWNVSVLRTNAA